MSQPRKLTQEAEAEIAAAALARDRIPSDKELSDKYHVTMRRVQQIMTAARAKLRKPVGSTWSNPVDNQA